MGKKKSPALQHQLHCHPSLSCETDQGEVSSFFLNKAKTYLVCHRKSNAQQGGFGVRFLFKSRLSTEENDPLHMNTIGLGATVSFLQNSIHRSSGAMGQIGMRSGNGPTESNHSVQEGVEFMGINLLEFHMHQSFNRKMWFDIEHRWLGLEVVRHVFEPLIPPPSRSDDILFQFSLRMTSPCRERFQFLEALAGICFRFPTKKCIMSHSDDLLSVWNDSSLFHGYSTSFVNQQLDHSDIFTEVITTFSSFRDFKKDCSYDNMNLDRKWLVVRSIVFQMWLERSANKELKFQVIEKLTPGYHALLNGKHNKSGSKRKNVSAVLSPFQEANIKRRKIMIDPASKVDVSPPCSLLASQFVADPRYGMPAPILCDIVFIYFLTLFNILPSILRSAHGGNEITASLPNPIAAPILDVEPCNNQTVFPPSDHYASSSLDLKMYAEDDDLWTSLGLRLATDQDLDERLCSYLQIRASQGDIICKLSPLEVYMADGLSQLHHRRVTGPKNFWPKDEVSSSYKYIGISQRGIINSEYGLHIVRPSHGIFQDNSDSLPSRDDVSELIRAAVLHGTRDNTRSGSQYRLNIGCGGQDRPGGVPNPVIGKGFEENVRKDEMFNGDLIMSCIGSLALFVWLTMVGIQRRAKLPPLAPDAVRHYSYAKVLAEYLKILHPGCSIEDITIVVGVLFPNFNGCLWHLDKMNDLVFGYTKTGVLNICLISEDGKVVLHLQVSDDVLLVQ